jgi:RNA polymerase sigma factor (sigma-70 family)
MPYREDAELVVAVRDTNEQAFADLYDRYSDRIHDFCHSILRDRHEAGDAMQQTFLMAIENIGKLREPEKLKAWLYAIAKNDCYRRIRKRQRESPTESLEELVPARSQPERVAEQDDLQEVVWSAAAGLAVRDRMLLDLHLRQGLDGQELADAMGVKPSQVYVLMSRLKDQVERSLGALLVARAGRRDCPELDELLSTWDGRLTPLIRKRISRHVDNCEICGERRRQLASPLALLSAVTIVPAPSLLRGVFVERAKAQKLDTRAAKRAKAAHQTSFDRRGFPKEGSINAPAIVGIAAALVIAVGVLAGAFSLSSHSQPVVSTSSTHQSEVTTTSTPHAGTATTTGPKTAISTPGSTTTPSGHAPLSPLTTGSATTTPVRRSLVTPTTPGSSGAPGSSCTPPSSHLTPNGTSYDFGQQPVGGPAAAGYVTLLGTLSAGTCAGSSWSSFQIESIQITGPGSSAFSLGSPGCTGRSVPPLLCTQTVFFNPPSVGTWTATLVVNDNATAGSPQSVTLTGQGSGVT